MPRHPFAAFFFFTPIWLKLIRLSTSTGQPCLQVTAEKASLPIAACKVTSWWGLSLYFPLYFGTSPEGQFVYNNSQSVYWPYNSKARGATAISFKWPNPWHKYRRIEVRWQEEHQAPGRYIYWQILPTVKGQKHILHLHKNTTGPNNLCSGTEPFVLRQIKCKTAEYAHSPQPVGSKNSQHWFHNPKLASQESLHLHVLLWCAFKYMINWPAANMVIQNSFAFLIFAADQPC